MLRSSERSNSRWQVEVLPTPNKILPNLCQGVARSKVFLILLLAYAREILGIIAEDLKYNYSEQIPS